ncbi:MAG: fused DSP-PTPase phosphatase/NAD kinase-like protein [Gemmataceae bacterium]
MNRREISFLITGALVLGALSGCRCTNNDRVRYVPPPPGIGGCDRCAANGPLPPRFAPNGAPVPPGPAPVGMPVPPAGAFPAPPGTVAPPPGAIPAPTGVSIQQNGYRPPGPPTPSASSGVVPGVYLQQPEPAAPAKPMPNDSAVPPETRPYSPQTAEPPPARDAPSASPSLPVDIPQFAAVKTNVASGQQPFAGGIAWLKSHGYRTVLHVRSPGEDDSAAQKQFEQSGLRYLSLEVSPQTLSRDLVDQFNRLVADANNQPLFVYDRDGALAGALWYLHFRLVDGATDEKAREEAERLGFKQDGSDAHVKMWLAVQNLLKDIKN